MQFGLFGSAAARRPTSAEAGEFDSSEGFRDFIEYNVEAEALGFRGTFVVEHHFTGYGQVSATLNLLTWLGARTTTLRLGTAVLVLPWHNPVLLAEQAATLDLLSGGRLDFGVGKGYRWNEFAGFCVDMEEADGRFNEALDVITKSFASDTPFSHRGRYWQYDNIVVEPPSAATTCCSANTICRSRCWALSSSSSATSRPATALSNRCRSGSRALCTSHATRTTSPPRWSGASRVMYGSTICRA